MRVVALMNFTLRGKARDFNWHNAIGLWCAPVLIVLTITAMPISYRWAGDLIYKLTGTGAPFPSTGPGAGSPPIEVPKPPPGTKPLGYDALLAAAQKEVSAWNQITFRMGGGATVSTNTPPAAPRSEGRSSPSAVTVSIKERGGWPLFYAASLTLDPFTGAVLRQEKFSDHNLGRQVRFWTRFLHTGEALGPIGQAVAGLASFGALFLVWTGFALTWRRFVGRKSAAAGSLPT